MFLIHLNLWGSWLFAITNNFLHIFSPRVSIFWIHFTTYFSCPRLDGSSSIWRCNKLQATGPVSAQSHGSSQEAFIIGQTKVVNKINQKSSHLSTLHILFNFHLYFFLFNSFFFLGTALYFHKDRRKKGDSATDVFC